MSTDEELLEALIVIRDECCKRQYHCEKCRLWNDRLFDCSITESTPDGWVLNDDKNAMWRAIK